jgi:hypothetical protein
VREQIQPAGYLRVRDGLGDKPRIEAISGAACSQNARAVASLSDAKAPSRARLGE